MAGNMTESLDSMNMSSNLPNLQSFILSYNNLSSLSEVAQLGKEACPRLKLLALDGNPVTRK
jgi:Leucine-rich repeat (LRR) protein